MIMTVINLHLQVSRAVLQDVEREAEPMERMDIQRLIEISHILMKLDVAMKTIAMIGEDLKEAGDQLTRIEVLLDHPNRVIRLNQEDPMYRHQIERLIESNETEI
tara:strand:- start:399 stop:713 length:315 start_codon:yes stop_codon:yes gene_type:complete